MSRPTDFSVTARTVGRCPTRIVRRKDLPPFNETPITEGTMRLSDAIQLGAMITSQAFRALFKDDGACALGAALLAVGVSPKEARCSVRKLWPWALAVNADCPSCGLSRLVCQIIVHLNDDHRWAREIGRASCRERVEMAVVAVSLSKK